MTNTAQLLTTQATTLGYDALSERDLKEALLVLVTAPTPPNSSAQTLLTLAGTLTYDSLSQKGQMLALVGFYANASNTTAKAALVTAAANFYGALSDRALDEGILSILA